jgi:putative colanic acid biosynthesis acetyltransferase WcaF
METVNQQNRRQQFVAAQKRVNNASYVHVHQKGASSLKNLLWYVVNALVFKSSLFPVSSIKVSMLKLFGAKIGTGVVVKPCVNIKYPWRLEVGNHTWIGENVWIDNLNHVFIGSHVCLSQGALLLTGSHDHTRTSFDFMAGTINLEDGVWIGARAVVSGGVRCYSHSILGINSVAEADLQAYTIYKGNPAIAVVKRTIAE